MKKYDIEIDSGDTTGTISVATEQREAVLAMLKDLPYIDKAYIPLGYKTQISIYISALAEADDLAELGAKVAEIVC